MARKKTIVTTAPAVNTAITTTNAAKSMAIPGKAESGRDKALTEISETLDAILAVMLTDKLGANGDEAFLFTKNRAQGKLARLLKGFGIVSVNDGTFPRMVRGRGMGVPDVRYNGEQWRAFPIAGDTYVTADVAEDIKAFAGDDCGKGGDK